MKSGEIYDITLSTHSHQLLLDGHSRREMHGLDLNPVEKDEFCTVGDDGVLRIWSISRNICVRKLALECACRAVAWNTTGTQLVVGVGGDSSQAVKDGSFMIVSNNPMEVVFEDRKAKLAISDIKFSPQGSIVAIASKDGKVYLHETSRYSLIRTMELADKEQGISRIDFNMSGAYIRICSTGEDLYNYAVADGLIVASPGIVRDESWKSNNSPYSWMIKGIIYF
jgi:WD40 repeat protein